MAITNTDFSYHVPATVVEVIKLLNEYGESAKIIAGGSDLIPKMKADVVIPEHVISLKAIKGLDYIDYNEDTGLRFGAKTTLRKLEDESVIKEKYPALYQAIHCMSSTQIRNRGTVVGNICNAIPSADCAPALMVLGASVKIESFTGARIVPLDEFFTGVCTTVVAENEMVTEVQIPPVTQGAVSFYSRYTVRKALDLAMVGVAMNIKVENGVCEDVKIALGAVAATPKHATNAEIMLLGQRLTDELIEKAAVCASQQDCAPISDIRASADYRREVVRLLVRDGLKTTW